MIVKDGLEDLKRLQPIVEPYIDEWIVIVPPNDPALDWEQDSIKIIPQLHTQPMDKKVLKEMNLRLPGFHIPDSYQLFNFADARNASFAEATGTHILWLDADDNPKGLKNLREIVESSDADMFEAVYDYGKDEEGNSISDHIRERVIKNEGNFEWKGSELGLIHETIVPKGMFAPYIYNIEDKDFYVEHLSQHVGESSDRNLIALLYEYLKTDGKDARTTFYLGTELFNHRMYAESINVMLEYVKVGGWDEERFRAWLSIAEAHAQLGDSNSSRNAYLEAQKELPNRPDSYLGLGESYYETGDYVKAIDYMMTGLSKPLPDTKHSVDKMKYSFRPSVYIALASIELGRQEEAFKWFVKAAKMNPSHPWIDQYKGLFVEAKDLDDYVKSFVKLAQISKRLYPRTVGKLAEVIPDELMGQEILFDFKRRFSAPKVWPDNSIVYYCSSVLEDWGPDSLKTGCGGSEEAVIHLTKRWAAMGYEVTVFCNCPEEKTVDGVKWLRYERFNPRDIFNILISWRNNVFIESRVARKKLIDVHDVPDNHYYQPEQVKNAKIMVKSNFHRKLFPQLPDDQFVVIPNGIDKSQFAHIPEKTKNNLVWTSSYDRGLVHLLEMWPDILKEVPDATLDIAYGWQLLDSSPFGQSEGGQAFKARMIELMDQKGITHHGRLNSVDVSTLYLKADVWAYPTDFMEIDCITATKAMAAKCVPITTDYAVMAERNQGIIIKGDIKDTKKMFKQNLVDLLKDEKRKEAIRNKIDVSEFDWDKTAKKWTELF